MKRLFFAIVVLIVFSPLALRGQQVSRFPYVAVPMYIGSDSEAAEWSALHFWDSYDFARAESGYAEEVNRQGFMSFVRVLYEVPVAMWAKAVDAMMSGAAVNEEGYWLFLEVAETVLYDPSSPWRNDLLWERFLRHAVGSRSPLDAPSRERYISMLKLVERNQRGSVAADFAYTLADGRTGRLHKINAPFTLLFFYNPGCSECVHTKEVLHSTGLLDGLRSRGVLKVLALYPDGEVDEWRKSVGENPEWWITAHDKGMVINTQELYDLKAIPTLYLLDSQKRVVLKDPTLEELIGLLERL